MFIAMTGKRMTVSESKTSLVEVAAQWRQMKLNFGLFESINFIR